MSFAGVDFYSIDELFSEEERIVRDTVRRFVDNRVVPIIEECFNQARFPKELIGELAELGCIGPTIPEEYGGGGSSYTIYGLMMQELERGDSGIRSFCSVMSSLVMYPIFTFGTEEQKRKYLPKLAKGELIGCFGLTEPNYGSNPAGLVTSAKKDGDFWVLNGSKTWITNAGFADIAVIWARTDEGIRGFIVEADTKGFEQREIKNKFSLRASVTGEIFLEDCRVPAENLLPGSSIGLRAALMCLTQARYGIAWGGVGVAMAVYDATLKYAKERIQFDRPIAGFQLVQSKLVWILNEITKAQLLCWRLGRMMDAGIAKYYHVSLAKMNNVRMALDAARLCRDIHGAYGITTDYPIIRHMLNMESVNTYEGTEDINRLIVGREITGLEAFK